MIFFLLHRTADRQRPVNSVLHRPDFGRTRPSVDCVGAQIRCRIFVSVVVDTAIGTRPLTDSQRQLR